MIWKTLYSRLKASLIVMIGISILIFAVARVMPGDPARIALGANASAEQVAALRADRHLDDPLPLQYWEFVKALSHGDLGKSLFTNRPVSTDIAQFLPATLELVVVSGLIMALLGLPIGAVSAHFRGRAIDQIGRLVALLGVCTPAFVWGVILQLLLGYFWPIFPIQGRLMDATPVPPTVTGFYLLDSLIAGEPGTFLDALHHLILPAVALALGGMGQVARLTRSNMIEVYGKPYVEMAEAYGFRPWRIVSRYAFVPAFIPTLTILGLEFAALLGNAFLVEKVFGWPGLSRYGVDVILRKDLDAIVGTVLIIAAAFLIMNIVVDLLVTLINPRIRLSSRRD
ncbi:D-ala-D-ala transporter subunit; membrane component of ABC superfamily [uncultured Pleomorphomonas sp.]|uniref:D-ala-D-ala transporter subunit membrane component of ABC superfamily n=1 Tax=uncultured Pleomorphomonas sp. TaxID=442121 RepID=A0A212LFH0_9HYPH|nr:ABC transporter permease [uncultured Pleomorphomonas sp.]SCM76312.1 D-ala-D-ala transporter subunit; membrane component of ABC superfamily [uncultured Pleomorphomonas sp.]